VIAAIKEETFPEIEFRSALRIGFRRESFPSSSKLSIAKA